MECQLMVLECKDCDRNGKGMGLKRHPVRSRRSSWVILRSLNFDLWVTWSQ